MDRASPLSNDKRPGGIRFSAVLALWVVSFSPLQAQTEHVLYSFTGTADGANPWSSLVRDAKGNFYGTTNTSGTYGFGTVFELTAKGVEKVLYSFTGGADGLGPQTGLIIDAQSNLYGTTPGSVFQIAPNGTFKLLHTFQGSDGSGCYATLFRDAAGNLYGTTMYGGAHGAGTVFEITPEGAEKVLYSFTGVADGGYPWGGVVRVGTTLYGTTNGGGDGYGTVFKLTANGKQTVLHTFTGGADGSSPEGNLIADSKGNLYGTTYTGGQGCSIGCGTIYRIAPSGVKTVIYSFVGGSDASNPTNGLVRDANGNLYGATPYGGNASTCSGCGAVFEISPEGQETLLYPLPGGPQGANPVRGVIRDTQGNLYGTTFFGGNPNCSQGCGVVFKLTP